MKVKKMHKPDGENDVKNETSGRKLNSFMKDIVMFITEIKLMINNLVEKSNEKKTKRKNNVHIFYKNNLEYYVEKVRKYFFNLSNDLYDASSVFYNIIWKRLDGRFLGYLLCFMLTVFFFLILGTVSLATNNPIFTLISFIPISLIPIDFVVTAISFIVVRLNRVYKNLLSDMKKEYGIKNDKDLVEVYRKEKGVTKEVKKVNTKNSVKNTVVSSEKSDSLFLERMLGYVSNSKYVPVENREKFLDEINFILNKYSMLKSEYPGKRVEQYLASDIEHLHGEYTRYLDNNNNNYSRKLK